MGWPCRKPLDNSRMRYEPIYSSVRACTSCKGLARCLVLENCIDVPRAYRLLAPFIALARSKLGYGNLACGLLHALRIFHQAQKRKTGTCIVSPPPPIVLAETMKTSLPTWTGCLPLKMATDDPRTTNELGLETLQSYEEQDIERNTNWP
jgi:hypothetical protein